MSGRSDGWVRQGWLTEGLVIKGELIVSDLQHVGMSAEPQGQDLAFR